MANHTLLEEFKELIEEITKEVISEVHMRDVAEDVVTRSYKSEIQDSLDQLAQQVTEAEKNTAAIKIVYVEDVTQLINEVKAEITAKVTQEIGQINSHIEAIIERVLGDSESRITNLISQKSEALEQKIKRDFELQEINYLAEIGKLEVIMKRLENDLQAEKQQGELRAERQQKLMEKKFKTFMAVQGVMLVVLVGFIIYMVIGYGA